MSRQSIGHPASGAARSDSAGQRPDVSARRSTRPDFIVVGVMRSGTSALHRLLDDSPAISMSDPKEPHHFVAHHYDGFTGPGDSWIASQVVRSTEQYTHVVRPRDGARISGEASATYFYYDDALSAIADRLPNVKIIVLLREPIARAYSAYWYLRSQNREWLRSFGAALDAEANRIASGFGPMWHYTGASMYAAGLQRCYQLFGADRVFVSTHERLVRDPEGLLAEIAAFLSVPEWSVERGRGPTNSSGRPRGALANAALHPPAGLRRVLRNILPWRAVGVVRRARARNLGAVPQLTDADRRRLVGLFADDIEAVVRLAGINVNEWGRGRRGDDK